MKVYVLLYQSYSYYDNDTTNSIKVFADRGSAIHYLDVLKEQLIENALEELNLKTVQELEESFENDSEYIYSYTNEDDYYYIDIEDWGTDTLSILEEDVMTF